MRLSEALLHTFAPIASLLHVRSISNKLAFLHIFLTYLQTWKVTLTRLTRTLKITHPHPNVQLKKSQKILL